MNHNKYIEDYRNKESCIPNSGNKTSRESVIRKAQQQATLSNTYIER
jgi:hypothetical protein